MEQEKRERTEAKFLKKMLRIFPGEPHITAHKRTNAIDVEDCDFTTDILQMLAMSLQHVCKLDHV